MTGDTLILFAYLEHPKTCEPFPSFRNPLNRAGQSIAVRTKPRRGFTRVGGKEELWWAKL